MIKPLIIFMTLFHGYKSIINKYKLINCFLGILLNISLSNNRSAFVERRLPLNIPRFFILRIFIDSSAWSATVLSSNQEKKFSNRRDEHFGASR